MDNQPIAKVRRLSRREFLNLVGTGLGALALSACSVKPTEDMPPEVQKLPTPTPESLQPTPQPTQTPSPTPTEVPLTPEQQLAEYLKTDEAKKSIDQFVNAMNVAGIEINKEQILKGIVYQEFNDMFGNPFVLASYLYNPDPNQSGELLEGPIVFAMIKQNENKEWFLTTRQREIETALGYSVGTVLQPHKESRDIQINEFNRCTITYNWQRREPTQGTYSLDYVNKQLNLAHKAQQPFPIRLSHISSSDCEPDWLKQIQSNEELRNVLRNQVRILIETYSKKGVTEFNVVNEPYFSSYFPKRLGREEYITVAYQEANLVREELIKKAQENGEELPKIELGFSNAENHHANGYGTQPTLEILKLLADKGWVDYVDVHFHIKKTTNLPTPEDVTNTLKRYSQFINKSTGKQIRVIVGEMDINISDISTSDDTRFYKQAKIGQQYFKAILDAGITDITFWGSADYDSWYENGDLPIKETNADALLFDDNNQPKLLNYIFIQSLILSLNK